MISRRGLLTGLVSFLAAPAIVRAASLDGLSVLRGTPLLTELPFADPSPAVAEFDYLYRNISLGYTITREAIEENLLRVPALPTNFTLYDLDEIDEGDPLYDA
jgi:hypothetical protein